MVDEIKPIVYASDGSNSHPKGEAPGGAAFVIYRDDGTTKSPRYFHLKTGTNNECEMWGLMMAIAEAAMNNDYSRPIVIQTDSQWCAYTVAGRLSLDYLPHYQLAVKNAARFESMLNTIEMNWESNMTLKWVRREENKEADRASKKAREDAIKLYGGKTE